MSCPESNTSSNCRGGGRNGYIVVVVLYILLAIILGSAINRC